MWPRWLMSLMGNETEKVLGTFPSWAESELGMTLTFPRETKPDREPGSGLFTAVAVSGLDPSALIGAPYQLPSWRRGALAPGRASLQPPQGARLASPRLGRGPWLGGGCPGRDTAPPGLGNGVAANAAGPAAAAKPSHAPGISQASGADRLQPGSQGEHRAAPSRAARLPALRGWRAGAAARRDTSPDPPGQGVPAGAELPPLHQDDYE